MKKIVLCAVVSTCFLTFVSAQITVLSEDFEQGIPASWTIVINDTNTVDTSVAEFAPGWIAVAEPADTANIVAGATSYFRYPAEADRWLILPAFTVGGYGNFIKWQARSQDPSYQDGYYVMVSTTDDQLASFTDTIATLGFENPDWTDREVNLSDKGYSNQTIHVAFRLRSYDAYKLYVDNIHARIDDPLGINELAAEPTIQLYPNPATDALTIKGEQVESVRILNMNGQLIQEQQLISGGTINVSRLEAGTYFVEVKTAKGTGHSKFMKR